MSFKHNPQDVTFFGVVNDFYAYDCTIETARQYVLLKQDKKLVKTSIPAPMSFADTPEGHPRTYTIRERIPHRVYLKDPLHG